MYEPFPVIVPIVEKQATCPECGKPEETVTVCKHCKHEYPESEIGFGTSVKKRNMNS